MKRLLVGIAFGLSASASPIAAQTTPYVPVSDIAYEDLDALISAGLVRRVMAGERPYSRRAFSRFVEEAQRRVAATTPSQRLREALERLTQRFQSPTRAGVRLAPGAAHVTIAVSPNRDARSGDITSLKLYGDSTLPIDADINPLLQGNFGRIVSDGATVAFRPVLSAWSRWFAMEFAPRVSLLAPRTHRALAGHATLASAYGRVVVGPVAFDAGRNNLVYGSGLAGGPMLSTNARGLDMLRLSAERPLELPGVLRVLGIWQAQLAVAALGSNRDIPGSNLYAWRIGARPVTFAEFGLTALNIQNGRGSPDALWWQRTQDIFLFWVRDAPSTPISDKVVGADMRLLIPALQASLNVNFMTTDDRGKFTQPACGCWQDAVWQVGADVKGLGAGGRTDLALEWAHAGPRAHVHAQFTAGVTEDRRVLGNALGPNASSLTGRLTRNGAASRLSFTASWERYSGDDWYWDLIPNRGPWDYDWFRNADNPDEVRVRVTSDYVRHESSRGWSPSLRVGYEHVSRFNYTGGSRHNVLAEVVLRPTRNR